MSTETKRPTPQRSRRGVLALAGAGGAAAIAAALGRRETAQAGHGGGADPDAIHIADINNAPSGTTTELKGDGMAESDPVFSVWNQDGDLGSVAIAATGTGDAGAVRGVATNGIAIAGDSENAPAVYGHSVNHFGVHGQSDNSPGVLGDSQNGAGVQGFAPNGPGVDGDSQNAAGVRGTSENGTGGEFNSVIGPAVSGHSENGSGGEFGSTNGQGLGVSGPASFDANLDNHAFHLQNHGTGIGAGAIRALNSGEKPAILAESDNPAGPLLQSEFQAWRKAMLCGAACDTWWPVVRRLVSASAFVRSRRGAASRCASLVG